MYLKLFTNLSNLKKYQGRLEGLGKVFVVRIGLMKFRLGYFEVMIRWIAFFLWGGGLMVEY